MTAAVALLLDAPLQSWGDTSGFPDVRSTGRMPSLSAVTGMIASALGHDRSDDLDDGLLYADIWSRADRPGSRLRDYHTVGGGKGRGVPRSKDGKQSPHAMLTNRYYLSDAAFVSVWRPGPGLCPERVGAALANPARALYLGRRSCPPASDRVFLGMVNGDPAAFLRELPLLRDPDKSAKTVTVNHQSPGGDGVAATSGQIVSSVHDIASTFHPSKRRGAYRERQISTCTVQHTAEQCAGRGDAGLDAMLEHIDRRQT